MLIRTPNWLNEKFALLNKNKIDHLFLFYQLLFFAQLFTFFTTDQGLIAHFLITLVFWLSKKRTLDSYYFLLIFSFVIIFFIPALIFNYWDFNLFLGSSIRILSGYLVVRAYGKDFIEIFYSLLILLAVISLPFYFIQIVNPNIFYKFNFFHSLLTPSRAYAGHVNFLVFHFNTWGEFRNSGFMWEPAAFGAVLSWGLIINAYKFKFNDNVDMVIILTAMLSTVSIGTLTYIICYAGIYFINKKNMIRLFTSLIVLGTIIFFLSKSEFVETQRNYAAWKIGVYQQYDVKGARKADATDVPRTTGFLLDLKYFVKNPLGYGFYRNQFEYPNLAGSPCGLSRFFIKWGIFGLIFLILGYHKYIKYLSLEYNYKVSGDIIFLIILLLTLFGNPIDYDPFPTVFFLFGLNSKKMLSNNKFSRTLLSTRS